MRWWWRPLVALGPVPLAVVGWADDHVVGVAMLVVGVIPFAAMALARRPRWSMAGVTVGPELGNKVLY